MTDQAAWIDVVHRLVDRVMVGGDFEELEAIATPGFAAGARRWIEPFRQSFPDVRMEIVETVADGSTVVARLRCSGTQLGSWRGHPPTGRRFSDIDEVYFFRFEGDRLAGAWGVEDNLTRFRQLGIHEL
ncbi:ester cyclase [Lysobacter korlensis]|uniref:Ester cyclase n=1 Tax=Lysobacter korlensis TaxID=553636 RepID=A0ABV6RXK5_9GAMM